jgi:TonB family protein
LEPDPSRNCSDSDPQTILGAESSSITRAAAEGDAETIRTLLANGTPVDTLSSGGQTPLMIASIFGHEEVVALLLRAGADASLSDPRDLTAKEWAVRRGFRDVAQLIDKHSGHRASPHRTPTVPTSTDRTSVQEPSTNANEVTADKDQVATPKMGGAAAAILRNRLGQSLDEPAADDKNVSIEEPTPAIEQTAAKVSTDEPTPNPPAAVPTPRVAEPDSTPSLPQDEARVLPFIPKQIEESKYFRTMPAQDDWAPNTPPPDVVFAKDISAAELNVLPERDADAPTADHEGKTAEVLPLKKEPTRPATQYSAPPSFLVDSPAPASSGRPLIWVLIVVTLGASAYGAYRLNSYLSRQEPAPAVATQQVQPQPQNAAPPSSSPSSDGSVNVSKSDHTTPVTGGPLAGAEESLAKAEYPDSALRKGVEEVITITVRVNRQGRVISWRTGSGDSSLRAAALKAARRSTFSPEKLPGNGEVVGTITYNFKLPKESAAPR